MALGLGLVVALLAGAGCKAVRPLTLPVVGSMGDPGNGQLWDDLDIYLIDPAGGSAVRVTNTPDLMETDPDLNRDRDRLVYVRRAANPGAYSVFESPTSPTPSHVVTCGPDGTGERVLHESPSLCLTPVWSHDGKRIAFTEMNNEGRFEVRLINADGSGLQTLGYGSSPSWRKDDRAVFYSSLDRPDATEGTLQLRELGSGVIHSVGLPGTGHTNLRAGVSIAYTSTPYSRRNESVWLMDANGGQFRLTDPGESEHDLQPVFFGSEGDLVFTRFDDAQDTYRLMTIHRRTEDRVATLIDQPAPVCFTRGGLWVARHYPR
jgi:Tol biopolymer transport system component